MGGRKKVDKKSRKEGHKLERGIKDGLLKIKSGSKRLEPLMNEKGRRRDSKRLRERKERIKKKTNEEGR